MLESIEIIVAELEILNEMQIEALDKYEGNKDKLIISQSLFNDLISKKITELKEQIKEEQE